MNGKTLIHFMPEGRFETSTGCPLYPEDIAAAEEILEHIRKGTGKTAHVVWDDRRKQYLLITNGNEIDYHWDDQCADESLRKEVEYIKAEAG